MAGAAPSHVGPEHDFAASPLPLRSVPYVFAGGLTATGPGALHAENRNVVGAGPLLPIPRISGLAMQRPLLRPPNFSGL